MLNHAIKDGSYLNVGVVVHGDDFARWAVLPLLVRHLADVLRQLVDRQARASIDRLALHRAARRQNVGGPLPLVVWAASHEAQIV